jgi:hypothetical protein
MRKTEAARKGNLTPAGRIGYPCCRKERTVKRYLRLRAVLVPDLLALVIVAAGALAVPASASLRPTGDIVERFGADPLKADSQGKFPPWFASGSWRWEPQGTTLSSKGQGMGSLLWMPGSHFTGTLKLRFRLGSGQSRARLLFAYDPASGAHRWAEVAAGSPGRISVGQTGAIRGSAAGVIQVWRAPVAAGVWQELGLLIAPDKSVTVTLGGAQLFRAAAAPLAPGMVGFASIGGSVAFDEFSFTANPDGEPCRECHAGQPTQPLAANVYTYWDGRWWDANMNGNSRVQEGGHGDPGGKPAVGCTGANGCHEMRQPSLTGHRNGIREGRAHQSVNSYHLRTGFIVGIAEHPWDAQVFFDNYCATACHPGAGVLAMTHASDAFPAEGAVQFGTDMTWSDGESLSIPVDSDITRRATPAAPDFAPCISCHDPHGSASAKVSDPDRGIRPSNRMLRADYTIQSSRLCSLCHR